MHRATEVKIHQREVEPGVWRYSTNNRDITAAPADFTTATNAATVVVPYHRVRLSTHSPFPQHPLVKYIRSQYCAWTRLLLIRPRFQRAHLSSWTVNILPVEARYVLLCAQNITNVADIHADTALAIFQPYIPTSRTTVRSQLVCQGNRRQTRHPWTSLRRCFRTRVFVERCQCRW